MYEPFRPVFNWRRVGVTVAVAVASRAGVIKWEEAAAAVVLPFGDRNDVAIVVFLAQFQGNFGASCWRGRQYGVYRAYSGLL